MHKLPGKQLVKSDPDFRILPIVTKYTSHNTSFRIHILYFEKEAAIWIKKR